MEGGQGGGRQPQRAGVQGGQGAPAARVRRTRRQAPGRRRSRTGGARKAQTVGLWPYGVGALATRGTGGQLEYGDRAGRSPGESVPAFVVVALAPPAFRRTQPLGGPDGNRNR